MFISDEEYKVISEAAHATEVLWCCRFEYINDGEVIEVVSGWRRRNFVTTSGRSQEGSWFCTLCEVSRPQCAHISFARSILVSKVKGNIEEIFFNNKEGDHSRTDATRLAQIFVWVFKKAMNNEPMGQKYEQYVPVTLFEDLLGIKRYDKIFIDTLKILEDDGVLISQEGILVDYHEAQREAEYWKMKTGHYNLRINDYGGWACTYCMQFSDNPDAKYFQCVKSIDSEKWIQVKEVKRFIKEKEES